MTYKKYPDYILKIKHKETGEYASICALYKNDYGGFNVVWSREVESITVKNQAGKSIKVTLSEWWFNGYVYKALNKVKKAVSNTDATDDL